MTIFALEQRVPVGRLAEVEEELEVAVSIFRRESGDDAGAPIGFAFPVQPALLRHARPRPDGLQHGRALGRGRRDPRRLRPRRRRDSTLPATEVSPDVTANDVTVQRVVELLATLGVSERRLIGIGHAR